MTDSNASCPTSDQLRGLLDESLDAAQQAELQHHVDGCETCQKILESLVAGTESWDAAVGHLRDESPVDEPGLSDAVRRIKQDEFAQSAERPAEPDPLDFLEPSDQPGSIGRLGSYEVSEVIGRGGMGVVVKAYDPALHRVVAVKVLAPYLAHNPQARKRFIREAQAIAAVSHDHVITIHAIDESAEQPKIIMQYIEGRSLQEKLDADGSLDLKEILRISMQTAAGLAAAHAQGLVHRDVKPSNILLENGIQRVKLTDFGLARAVDDASLTQSGVIAGTPQYMAPEQANGDTVDYRADLFSLGSVMYAMCVGHSPFRASTTMGVLKRVCSDSPRPIHDLNPDIPDWLCGIIMKLLAKSPADRFQSAREVSELLERWLAHVQQPSVAAKPPLVTLPASSRETSAESDAAVRQPELVDNVYERTILFQPISGRMLLFFLLAGMAGTMAIVRARPVELPELLTLGLFGGMFVAAIGLLVVSLGRFVWANLVDGIAWMRGKKRPASTGGGSLRRASSLSHLPPESLAVLVAILSMILGAHLLLAAIIAIIVWRVTSSRINASGAMASTTVPDPKATSTMPVTDESAGPNSKLWSQVLRDGWERFTGEIRLLFSLPLSDRHRLAITIGWFLACVLDVMWTLFLFAAIKNMQPPILVVLFWAGLFYGILSFVTSCCVHFRYYLAEVMFASFLGLLPLSLGAILRVPLSVLTLFWQQQTVRQS